MLRTRSAVAALTLTVEALLWRTRETTVGVTPALAATSRIVTAIIYLTAFGLPIYHFWIALLEFLIRVTKDLGISVYQRLYKEFLEM